MEFWVTRNDKKMLLVLTCLDNQYHLLQLYLHFPFNLSKDSFLSNAGCFFLKDMKIAIYNWLSVLTDQMWQKFFLVLIYLDISTRTSWMKHIWIRLSRCVKWQWHLFECFFKWNKFSLCPFDCNVDKPNMQKGWINVVGMSILKLINL